MKEIHGHKVMMLTGGKKKGILRILFSRFFLMALLLVLQIGIGITIYMFFDENIKMIHIFDGALILVMLLYLFNSEMDSSAKLTWMFIISLFPVVGSLFLAYTQSNIGNRKLTEKVSRSIENTMDDLPQDESGPARDRGHPSCDMRSEGVHDRCRHYADHQQQPDVFHYADAAKAVAV